jgi:DNA end-binding protein Ku
MDAGLVLYKLRHPKEVRKMENVPQVEQKEVNKDELKLSISLVESMNTTLKDLDLTDRYRDALREMIEAKVGGKEVVAVSEEQKTVPDIMTALKQSIEQAQAKKKPMERAKGEAKEAAAEVAPVKQKKRKVA